MVSSLRRLPTIAEILGLAVCAAVTAWTSDGSAQDAACLQPPAVCAARDAVFAIAAFDPLASAVRISPDLLVTSRHGIADRTEVDLMLADGAWHKVRVIPTDYTGDIILLSAPDLPPGPVLTLAPGEASGPVYTVGADISFGRIRAYDPGAVTLTPAPGKALARLHHTAHNQPGNSGGALVDADGGLVGIVASGGEGRLEAVPAGALSDLKSASGPDRAAASAEIGAAVRICTLKLEEIRQSPGALDEQNAKALTTACRRTGNRQFYDLAAHTNPHNK